MNIANFISIGAVLVAIFALVWQVRQNSKQHRLHNFTTHTQRYQDIILNLPISIESIEFKLSAFSKEEKEKY